MKWITAQDVTELAAMFLMTREIHIPNKPLRRCAQKREKEATGHSDCPGLAQMVSMLAYGNLLVYSCTLFRIVQHPTIVHSMH